MSSGEDQTGNSGRPSNALQLATSAVVANSGGNGDPNPQPVLQQPRQPRDLQGLLRFAMEATAVEDPTSASHFETMDSERKQFLEKALKGMTVDIAEELRKAIEILRKVSELQLKDDPSEVEEALETVSSYVDHIDVANDFHKLGGLEILKPCLSSCHDTIQSRAAELVADLTQNNPYCQGHVLSAGLLPVLLKMVDDGASETAQVKALYAVSCLVRDNKPALEELIRLDGCSVLLRAIQSDVEKLRMKAAFLAGALCRQHAAIRDEFHTTGWVQQLSSVLSQERSQSHEHVLAALLALTQGHEAALEESRDPSLQLSSLLTNYVETHTGKPECLEEIDYARQILKLISRDDGSSIATTEDR